MEDAEDDDEREEDVAPVREVVLVRLQFPKNGVQTLNMNTFTQLLKSILLLRQDTHRTNLDISEIELSPTIRTEITERSDKKLGSK